MLGSVALSVAASCESAAGSRSSRRVMPRPRGFSAPPKRRRSHIEVATELPGESELTDSKAQADDEGMHICAVPSQSSSERHLQLAQMLWQCDYVSLMLHELLEYEDVAVIYHFKLIAPVIS